LPTPRLSFLVPSVTMPRYSTTVSQTLRASFSERRSADLTKIHLPIEQAMYACTPEIGGGFFEGVCALSDQACISADPPHPAIRGSLHACPVSV
jgi:hypothetical protein